MGALVATRAGRSAALAGAAAPSTIEPATPSKIFFIVFSTRHALGESTIIVAERLYTVSLSGCVSQKAHPQENSIRKNNAYILQSESERDPINKAGARPAIFLFSANVWRDQYFPMTGPP